LRAIAEWLIEGSSGGGVAAEAESIKLKKEAIESRIAKRNFLFLMVSLSYLSFNY
jgi:hypothetical protein